MSKKIIWLCSWYPNEIDRFTGDFIQRQAIAASLYDDIEVVHVVDATEDKCVVHDVNPRLKETIYYNKKNNKILRYKDFFQLHESFISDYIQRKGKPDVVHVHIPIKSGLVALRWKQNYNFPFLVTEHYGIYNEDIQDRFSKRNYLFRFFTKKIISLASYFLPVSKSLGEDVNKYLPHKEFVVVPNVVDTSIFHVQEKTQTTTPFRFVHVSNMAPIKNIEGLLHAFAIAYTERQDIQLYLIGSEKKKYVLLANKLNLLNKAVFFMPELSYEDVANEVMKADAGILFSFNETQSCAVLEWLCSGLPVLASAVGGVVELIHKENGILIESNNIQQLADAITYLVENYTNYNKKQLAAEASALYSYDAVGKQLHALYQRVM